MAGRIPSDTLTAGEVRLMQALWRRGPSTVAEIQSALDDALADSTVRTLLAILEDKGWVARSRRGRAHRYRAVIDREQAGRQGARQLVERFFGTPRDLVASLVRDEDLGDAELAELERMIRARRGSAP